MLEFDIAVAIVVVSGYVQTVSLSLVEEGLLSGIYASPHLSGSPTEIATITTSIH